MAEGNDTVLAAIAGLREEVAALRSDIRAATAIKPTTSRTRYSVEEVAELLGKASYTVREWCRNGQINATKRAERRGGSALWSISADEVERFRNEGLLPIDSARNLSRN